MAEAMDLDEVRDLIKYLMDRNDLGADPFSRSGLGAGYYDEAAFAPIKEYVETPTADLLRGAIMAARAGAPSPEAFIASEILENNGTVTTALARLKDAPDDELRAMGMPFYAVEDQNGQPQKDVDGNPVVKPDWRQIEGVAQGLWKDYITEQQQVAGLPQDPTNGKFYNEKPSEAAEKFQKLGLPLPTDNYGDEARAINPATFQQTNPWDADLRDLRAQVSQTRPEVNQSFQKWNDARNVPVDPERSAMIRQLLEGGEGNTMSPAAEMPPGPARSYADRAQDTGWTPSSLSLAQELGLVPAAMQDETPYSIAAQEEGWTPSSIALAESLGLLPQDVKDNKESYLAAAAAGEPRGGGGTGGAFINPASSAAAIWGDLGNAWNGITGAVGGLFGGDGESEMGEPGQGPENLGKLRSNYDKSNKALQDLVAEEQLLRNERADAYRNSVGIGSEAMYNAGVNFAKEDEGRTPLSDVMERIAMEYGLPSQFTPTYDPGSSGEQQAQSLSSQQFKPKERFVKADNSRKRNKDGTESYANPRFQLNRANAFYRYLNGG